MHICMHVHTTPGHAMQLMLKSPADQQDEHHQTAELLVEQAMLSVCVWNSGWHKRKDMMMMDEAKVRQPPGARAYSYRM